MNERSRYEDVSTLFFLVPFIASGVYGLYLWVGSGISLVLPSNVYLTVTRDPTVFVVGTLAVFLGLILEVAGVEPSSRMARLQSESGFLQKLAAASFVLSLIMALYANGFTGVTGAVSDFLVGRFSLAFPVMLVILSYLATAPFKRGALTRSRILGIVSMLLIPPVLYEVGKRNTPAGLGISLVLLIAGLYLFLKAERKTKQEAPA
ncbi:MAG: hypothetical protein LYZ69_09190 [Nitrososphaerales archaeon]|nr:hypothetical protein [Nitrososphaerales archaeon]